MSPTSTEIEALVGRGARAVVDGAKPFVGNQRLATEVAGDSSITAA